MYSLVRITAFVFKALNFFLDLWQTWQFAGGGGVVAVIAFITTYFQDKPLWFVVVLSLCVGIFLVCIASLIFKSYALRVTEDKRLRRLPRLVYDIHKRVCMRRDRLVKKTNWDSIDRDKILKPLNRVLFEKELEQEESKIDDDMVNVMAKRLKNAGKSMSGAPSVLDTYMRDSDVSLEKALQKDLWYRILTARLDSYKPYPSDAIRNSVQLMLDSMIGFNNAIILLLCFPDYPSIIDTHTSISNEKIHQIYINNKNAEKKMNDTIDIGLTMLKEQVDSYLKEKK